MFWSLEMSASRICIIYIYIVAFNDVYLSSYRKYTYIYIHKKFSPHDPKHFRFMSSCQIHPGMIRNMARASHKMKPHSSSKSEVGMTHHWIPSYRYIVKFGIIIPNPFEKIMDHFIFGRFLWIWGGCFWEPLKQYMDHLCWEEDFSWWLGGNNVVVPWPLRFGPWRPVHVP